MPCRVHLDRCSARDTAGDLFDVAEQSGRNRPALGQVPKRPVKLALQLRRTDRSPGPLGCSNIACGVGQPVDGHEDLLAGTPGRRWTVSLVWSPPALLALAVGTVDCHPQLSARFSLSAASSNTTRECIYDPTAGEPTHSMASLESEPGGNGPTVTVGSCRG